VSSNETSSDTGPPPHWDLDSLVGDLRLARERWRRTHRRHREIGKRGFPSRKAIEKILSDLRGALFPMRLGPGELSGDGEDQYVRRALDTALTALLTQVRLELGYIARDDENDPAKIDDRALSIVREFASSLPDVRTLLDSDVEAAYSGDPAARSVDEVLICYPGLIAIIHHRLAHRLHHLGARLVARIISEIAHSETGIDIHPGAVIGRSFFIDHGTGVVIGETAVIGERVRLYQAVTLGAKSFPTDANGWLQKGHARHPIIEDDVVIYAGATILGRITIGKGSKIGGNVWLTKSVPPGSSVNQATAHQETASHARRPKRPSEATSTSN
jgi:serine O-acetyltransferase